MNGLEIGTNQAGQPFYLPASAAVQTFAILAMRGAGKSVTATVMAEEFCKVRQPWICIDPVGIWWGLRCERDGRPGGYPVVVIGGQHGDLQLNKNDGERIAQAVIRANVFAVIDFSQESKSTWRRFLADFSLALMDLTPDVPRHIFIEEAPEFVPQKTKVALTMECKEAVERLVRLGRNRGYGCTLISQRPATVDKDVLSQCENVFVLRTTGPQDRRALKDWISAQASDAGLEKFLDEVAGLANGQAWFWSPQWLKTFEQVQIRQRYTLHPGATRVVGQGVTDATLSNAGEFVAALRKELAAAVPVKMNSNRRLESKMDLAEHGGPWSEAGKISILQEQVKRLESDLAVERGRRTDAERRLETVRAQLRPQYEGLQKLFTAIGTNSEPTGDPSVWQPWLNKANAGCRRMLEALLKHRSLTQDQLGTLSHIPRSSGTFRTYRGWLKRNGLVEIDGQTIRLKEV